MRNPIPPDEAVLFIAASTLSDTRTMIELGNKRNRFGTYKAWFSEHGIQHVSIDQNGRDGALPLDLRKPIALEQLGFDQPVDIVTNIGTSEHVVPQGLVWHNMLSWLKEDGYLISMTPLPEDWWWHGSFYPTEEWYRRFCALNGLEIGLAFVSREYPRRNNCLVAKKVKQLGYGEVQLPPDEHMFQNTIRPQGRR